MRRNIFIYLIGILCYLFSLSSLYTQESECEVRYSDYILYDTEGNEIQLQAECYEIKGALIASIIGRIQCSQDMNSLVKILPNF